MSFPPELALFLALLFGMDRHALNKAFHPGRAGLLHLLRNVTIDIQRKGRSMVAQVLLYRLDVVSTLDSSNGVAVPIRYNCDNTEKPSKLEG